MKLTRRKFMGSSILTALAAALGLKPQFEPDERLFVSTPNEETNPFYES